MFSIFPTLNSLLKTKKGKCIDFNYIYLNILPVSTLFVQTSIKSSTFFYQSKRNSAKMSSSLLLYTVIGLNFSPHFQRL